MSGTPFTRAWEDDRVDLAALAVQPGERVLAIAAAGDIPLALASEGAAELIAVDLNPAQLHLSALRIAAAGWDPDERYRWFECGRVDRVDEAYRTRLRPALGPDARAYWDVHIGAFTSGFHDSEGVGRTFNRLGAFVRFVVPGLARDLEGVATPAAQLRLWHERVQGRLFNRVTDWLARYTPMLAPLAPHREELDRMRRGGYLRAVESRVEGIVGTVLVRDIRGGRPRSSVGRSRSAMAPPGWTHRVARLWRRAPVGSGSSTATSRPFSPGSTPPHSIRRRSRTCRTGWTPTPPGGWPMPSFGRSVQAGAC